MNDTFTPEDMKFLFSQTILLFWLKQKKLNENLSGSWFGKNYSTERSFFFCLFKAFVYGWIFGEELQFIILFGIAHRYNNTPFGIFGIIIYRVRSMFHIPSCVSNSVATTQFPSRKITETWINPLWKKFWRWGILSEKPTEKWQQKIDGIISVPMHTISSDSVYSVLFISVKEDIFILSENNTSIFSCFNKNERKSEFLKAE